MSTTDEHLTELKGGHPPAVKAGGMRITQSKVTTQHADKPSPPKKSADGEEDGSDVEEEDVTSIPPPKANLVISGAITKGDKDFPKEAIQQFHDKPQSTHDCRPVNKHQMHQINQPRK